MRERQEDAFGMYEDVDGFDLFVISDGMGGHPNGAVASKTAVEYFPTAFRHARDFEKRLLEAEVVPWVAFRRRLEEAFFDVTSKILPSVGGATLSVLLRRRKDDRTVVAWAGDSPVLHLRREAGRPALRAVRSTKDHGLGWILGKMVGEPAISQSSSYERRLDKPEVEDWKTPEPGDLFLLCTDGVSGVFPSVPMRERFLSLGPRGERFLCEGHPSVERKIGERLSEHPVDAELPKWLVDEALNYDSSDNCTAICVSVEAL
jgi:serine/threonine protein phosphatase PrpC